MNFHFVTGLIAIKELLSDMKRYYFYSPSKHRQKTKENGVISFELAAFYAERAYSNKAGKEITRFYYIDQVDCVVDTRWKGNYRFEFDHGKDGAQGHWAKSSKELKDALAENGFGPVSEKNYFRLRKLSLNLMYRHTNFLAYWTGKNEYYYCNNTYSGFYDIRLASFHHHHQLKADTLMIRKWRYEIGIPSYCVKKSEEIRIFIANNRGDKKRYESFKFSIEANKLNRTANYTTFKEGVDSVYRKNEASKVTRHQYERLRKIAKFLIWENDELDISDLKKTQDYRVTILDA